MNISTTIVTNTNKKYNGYILNTKVQYATDIKLQQQVIMVYVSQNKSTNSVCKLVLLLSNISFSSCMKARILPIAAHIYLSFQYSKI